MRGFARMSERSNSGGETNNPYAAPMTAEFVSGPAVDPHTNEGDATGGLIPYKNPHALSAYYLGIISLLPLIGIPFGIASVILGVIGLRKRRANPVIERFGACNHRNRIGIAVTHLRCPGCPDVCRRACLEGQLIVSAIPAHRAVRSYLADVSTPCHKEIAVGVKRETFHVGE